MAHGSSRALQPKGPTAQEPARRLALHLQHSMRAEAKAHSLAAPSIMWVMFKTIRKYAIHPPIPVFRFPVPRSRFPSSGKRKPQIPKPQTQKTPNPETRIRNSQIPNSRIRNSQIPNSQTTNPSRKTHLKWVLGLGLPVCVLFYVRELRERSAANAF